MPQRDKNKNKVRDRQGEERALVPEVVIRKIRFLIDAHHETVPGLAKGIGVLPNTIQDVLDGQSFPSRALVRRLAERFSLPIEFFEAEVSAIDNHTAIPAKKRASGRSRVGQPARKKIQGKKTEGKKSTAAGHQRTRVAKSTPAQLPLDAAVLQQSLIELLIQKGVISADEWNARVRLVSNRKATSNR